MKPDSRRNNGRISYDEIMNEYKSRGYVFHEVDISLTKTILKGSIICVILIILGCILFEFTIPNTEPNQYPWIILISPLLIIPIHEMLHATGFLAFADTDKKS